MKKIICQVRDLATEQQRVLEHLLDRPLQRDERLIVQVLPRDHVQANASDSREAPSGTLPEWCDVYAGLADEQIAEIEEVIHQRCDLSRSFH